MTLTVHRAGDRFVTSRDGSRSRYSFSFGHHYDPANTSFGAIVAINDEVVEVGSGFDEHPHAGVDIVTYVVTGSLEHQDNSGPGTVLEAGEVGVLHSGGGVQHSERNSGAEPLRFVQSWLIGEPGIPSYTTGQGTPEHGQLVAVVAVAGGTLYVGHLGQGDAVALPEAPRLLVFVVSGDVSLDGAILGRGDAARLTDRTAEMTAASDCELLVWALHAP